MTRVLLSLLAAVLAALLVAPAFASFPGGNGRLAVTLDGCEETQFIRALTTLGRSAGDLTPRCEMLGEDDARDTYAPEWTPDGTRLLHVDSDYREGGPGTRLASVAAAGGDRRDEGPLPRPDVAPSLSPDGRRVVYSDDGTLVVTALDGSGRRVLRAKSCSPSTGCRVWERPRWSPNGRWIAVQRSGWGALDGLWLVDAASGRLVRRLVRGAAEPDWSPDGKRLVFRTSYYQHEIGGGASGGNIYLVRADGRGKPQRIVHRKRIAETSPVFSPDGRWIAWVSLRFTAGDVSFRVYPSLWKLRLGGRPQKVALLPEPNVDEGDFNGLDLAWQPRPGSRR